MKKWGCIFSVLLLAFGCQNPKEEPDKTVQEKPDSPQKIDQSVEFYAEKARESLYRQNLEQSRNYLNQGMAADSNFAEIRELRGEMFFMLNQTRYAKNEWERCLELDPSNQNCILSLAELMIAVRNYDRALELADQLLEVDKNSAQGYFVKGIIVRDLNRDTALALQNFQQAIDLRQDYMEAIDMMAVTLAQRGDTLAKFYYDRLLQMDPNNAQTYFKLGVYYMQMDEPNRALENYTKAVQLNPGDGESYYNMGFIHINIKQFAQARDYFSKAISVSNRPYRSLYGRGYANEMLGDVLNARKDYRSALEILPQHTPSQAALSRVNAIIDKEM